MTLKLGTRTSALAWTQSSMVAAAIGPDVEMIGKQTAGDLVVDAPLRGPLQKGWFTEALEAALRSGEIDLAVHSLKDLPVADPAGLTVGAILQRAAVSDLLFVREEAWNPGGLLPVRPGGTVGASAPRRHALLRTLRPDLEAAWLRGNVTTRLERLAEGRFDAILLAEAGVTRLGEKGRTPPGVRVARLLPQHWPPAPGQGALAVQCRADDERVLARLRPLDHAPTRAAVDAERAWLTRLGGGCAVPFGAWTEGDAWALGLERDGRFHIARGPGDPVAALDAILAGAEGQAWEGPIWEEV